MFSNVIAFMDYDLTAGWFGLASPFVGFKWFARIFQDPKFYELVGRTLSYSVAVLVVSVPAPFVLAMLMNELMHKAFKRTVQTISYLPHFISWVTIASLIYIFLSTDTSGIVNNLRQFLGADKRILFMKYPKNFPVVLAPRSVYKEMGWGSIIYLAAISALDVELYEAASIDGAGRWRQFQHITFPGVLPTTMILLIFAMAGLLSTNFDQIYNLQNDIIILDTNTINVYTYRTGVLGRKYSIATAVGPVPGRRELRHAPRRELGQQAADRATGSSRGTRMRTNRIRRTAGEAVFNVFNIVFLCIICFVTIFPFWYVLMISLNDGRDTALGGIYFYPRKSTLANYAYVLCAAGAAHRVPSTPSCAPSSGPSCASWCRAWPRTR